MQKQRVTSGIQTSGNLHLGNYLGAIKRWVDMQNTYDSFIFLADLHAITVNISPEELKKSTIESAAGLLACGLTPDKSTIFVQSHIQAHTELGWILSCITPMGWLSRMTQFKDKAGKDKENASVGLYTYPILQAADVLLYDTDLVPVGEDQKQHIELMRDIAGVVNRKFGYDIFKLPEPLIGKESARIKSLRDGTKKMSKSDPSDASRINLSDDKDSIYNKFKRAKTDSIENISYDTENRPEISNLITIYSRLSEKTIENIVKEYENAGFARFKEDLAELVVSHFGEITTKYKELLREPGEILSLLKKGAEKANEIASKKLETVKREFGFWS